MQFVLGIDGGGTGTRATILNEQGQIRGSGVSGPSNYDDVGKAEAQNNLRLAVEMARREAGIGQTSFAAAFLGLAGISSETDRQVIVEMAENLRLAPKDRTGIHHDIRIALEGGLMGRPGIVLIAGTGSSCYGRNASGQEWRSGGWGPLISDEGSGYWFGIQAMKAAVRSYDGRWEKSQLFPVVLERLGLNHIDDILRYLYFRGITRSEIAALGSLVFEAAAEEDEIALDLIEAGATEMAHCVAAVASNIGYLDQPCELALSGGVFQAGEIVVRPLRAAVLQKIPRCEVCMAELPSVIGAGMLALELIGVKLDENQLNNLKEMLKQQNRI